MKKATVADPSPRMAELEAKRALTRCIMGGTKAMIAAGKTWLDQHPGESDGNYAVRLKSNILSNFVEQAVDKAKNRIMAKEITLKDVPPELEALLDDIDLQGRDLNAFAMDILRQAFADGVTYILADKPQADGVQTVADAKAKGIRPYAIHVQACCLLEVLSEMINGVRTITRIRIKECTQVPDGEWGYVDQEQVRVLLRQPDGAITFQIWREEQKANAVSKEWVMVEEGPTAMKSIALVPVYANRVGYMEGEPVFQATAELNLDHWRVKSEQKNALTMNCFEMLAATGVPEGWTPKVGPAQCQVSNDPESKFYYLSPTGKGVELAASYLKDIEAQIETAQASLRVENAGKVTATAAALDSEEGCAGLKAVAGAFGDALELLLGYFAEMMGMDKDKVGEVQVNADMGAKRGSDIGMQELGKTRLAGDISRKAYFEEMKWRGEISPTFDEDANDKALAHEEEQNALKGPDPATMTKRPQPVA